MKVLSFINIKIIAKENKFKFSRDEVASQLPSLWYKPTLLQCLDRNPSVYKAGFEFNDPPVVCSIAINIYKIENKKMKSFFISTANARIHHDRLSAVKREVMASKPILLSLMK